MYAHTHTPTPDVQFWRSRKTLEGLSVRSVFFNVFQSFIVLLYILDNETNFVIIISVFIGKLLGLLYLMEWDWKPHICHDTFRVCHIGDVNAQTLTTLYCREEQVLEFSLSLKRLPKELGYDHYTASHIFTCV